jgi:SAM-dependent methyltransferase
MNPKPAPSERDLMRRAEDGLFDFQHTSSFAEKYLQTFYLDREPTNDERIVFQFVAEHLRALPGRPALLEVGCGPTVHHALQVAPYVSELHMADYLHENLEEVRKWRDRLPGARRWSQYADLALGLEGQPVGDGEVRRLEEMTRRKLQQLLTCDLRNQWILGSPAQYQLVTAFYCTEEVGITIPRWEEVMANLARVVAPGGQLFLACLRDTDSYLVGECAYPCARITEDDVRRVLPELGFDMAHSIVESAAVADQEHEGVLGVVLTAARKAG